MKRVQAIVAALIPAAMLTAPVDALVIDIPAGFTVDINEPLIPPPSGFLWTYTIASPFPTIIAGFSFDASLTVSESYISPDGLLLSRSREERLVCSSLENCSLVNMLGPADGYYVSVASIGNRPGDAPSTPIINFMFRNPRTENVCGPSPVTGAICSRSIAYGPITYHVSLHSDAGSTATFLVTNQHALPEPETWSLFILGFGLAGVVTRLRRSSPIRRG